MLFWLAYDNHVTRSSTTIVASSEVGTFVASHLADKRLFRQWRCDGVTGYVDVDFGADRDIDFLGAVGPRIIDPNQRDDTQWFQSTDQVRHFLDASADSFGTGGVYNSGWIDGGIYPDRGYHAHLIGSKKTARKWRMQFDIASRAIPDYFDLSFLFASEIFAPAINYSYGDELDTDDSSLLVRAPVSGGFFSSKYDRLLTFSATFDFIPSTDRDAWIAFNDHVGTTEPFFLGLNNASPLGRKVMMATQVRTYSLSERNFIYSARNFVSKEYR